MARKGHVGRQPGLTMSSKPYYCLRFPCDNAALIPLPTTQVVVVLAPASIGEHGVRRKGLAMKILLVDDHSLFRDGLRHLLNGLDADATVLEAGSGSEALAAVGQNPDLDLILLDLSLPDLGGLEILARLHDKQPEIPVVVLSGSEQVSDIIAALEGGARGYIPKSSSSHVLCAALKLVFAGAVYVPPAVFAAPCPAAARPAPKLADLWCAGGSVSDPAALGLTPRQQDVLKLIVEGKSNKLIARELGIEESTVKVHISPVLKALKVVNRVHAILAVSRLGIKFDSLSREHRHAAAAALKADPAKPQMTAATGGPDDDTPPEPVSLRLLHSRIGTWPL